MSKSSRSNKHDQWSELKSLLMEEEVARLKRLEDKIIPPENFARAIGDVLPDAVQNTTDKQRLSQKLYPVVEESLYRSVQKNPDSLADAIYPVMAPAIRKAINEAMKKVTESVNSSVNSGLSAKTMKWRFQALVSGQSYGDLVLKYSLLYQVQEIYLIHNETGLLISHLSQKTGENPDGDMISGMLTAIRNFVADSFNVGEGQSLETIQVGELVVIIEQGPHASLACVIKGDPSTEFRDTLNLAVENIHKEFGSDLIKFSGDPDPLEDAQLMMEKCLITQLDEGETEESGKMGKILLGIGIILFLLIGYSSFWGIYWKGLKKDLIKNTRYEVVISDKNWHNYTLIVTNTNKPFYGKIIDSTSSDKDMTKNDLLLKKYNLSFEDFVDFHLRSGKQETKTNRFYRFKKNRLTAIQLASTSPEPVKVTPSPRDTLKIIQAQIDNLLLFFKVGSDELMPGQRSKISSLQNYLTRADTLCALLNETWVLSISGSSDTTGSLKLNQELEKQRSFYTVDELMPDDLKNIVIIWKRASITKRRKIEDQMENDRQKRHVSFELKNLNEP